MTLPSRAESCIKKTLFTHSLREEGLRNGLDISCNNPGRLTLPDTHFLSKNCFASTEM